MTAARVAHPVHRRADTVFGPVIAVVGDTPHGRALGGLWFDGQRHLPPADALGSPDRGRDPLLDRTLEQLTRWIAGQRSGFDLPLAAGPQDRSLAARVRQALLEVPYGTTTTYRELAARAGAPRAYRAVGQAVGRNPWLIVVPCHRVLTADGGLSGYAAGPEVKRRLLEHEAAHRPSEPRR